MPKPIWNGKGDAEGCVYFVDTKGIVRGRPYVRRVVRRMIVREFGLLRRSEIVAVLAQTVDRDDWLRSLDGVLPTAVGRMVIDGLRTGAIDLEQPTGGADATP